MKKITLLFMALLMFSCGNEGGTTTGGEKGKTSEDSIKLPPPPPPTKLNTEKKHKTLLIIAEDRSGSTGAIRKMTVDDYKDIMSSYAQKNYGQIAVRIIGNPSPQERQFFMVTLDAPYPYETIPKDAKMSEIGKINTQNRKIEQKNMEISRQNLQKVNSFIDNKISKHIINYKPYKNKDLTDIQDVFEHIKVKVNEPTFNDYDKIQILIVSDGIHDANKLKKPLHLDLNKKAEIFLIGWKDKSVFEGLPQVSEFESIESFKSYYQSK